MWNTARSGRLWTGLAALLIFAMALVPALRPGWFVEPTGSIRVLGGPLFAAGIALGLIRGIRWVRYATVGTLASLFVLTLLIPWLAGGNPAVVMGRPAHLGLFGAGLAALAILAFHPRVREFFDPEAD